MQASYEDVVGFLSAREGAFCELAGCPLAEAPALAGGLLAGVEVPVDAPGMRVCAILGSIEPLTGSIRGHRVAIRRGSGIEVGSVTLTRNSFAGAELDPGAPVLLVEIGVSDRAEHAGSLDQEVGLDSWVWVFDFSGPRTNAGAPT